MKNRDDEIKRLRHNEKWTLQDIGDRFGISRERVRQIVGNTGRVRYTKLRRIVKNNTDKTSRQLQDELGVSDSFVRKHRNRNTWYPKESIEHYIIGDLKEMGWSVEFADANKLFHILVDGVVRISISFCTSLCKTNPGIISNQWQFSFSNPTKCDFYYLLTGNKDVFIVPSNIIRSKRIAFCYPTKRPNISKYLEYHERYDLITDFINKKQPSCQ